jgi:hypothetical protein
MWWIPWLIILLEILVLWMRLGELFLGSGLPALGLVASARTLTGWVWP